MAEKMRLALVLSASLVLVACGFHLRRDAHLPTGMQTVYVSVSGNADFRRALTRALAAADATVVDAPGPGVAQLRVSQARYRTDALTVSGQGRISEKAVHFHVTFDAVDGKGTRIVPSQSVDMSREFTYSAANAIGQESQIRALQQSMLEDMVRAVMFRLEAAAAHPATADATKPTAD